MKENERWPCNESQWKEGHLLSYHSWGMGPMPVQACSQLYTLVAIVTHWQREASVVPGINSNPDNTTLNQGAICSEEPPETPLPICQGASEALCVHVYVWMWVGGKGGVREEVNQDLDVDGSGRRACMEKEYVYVCVREWMCGRGAWSLCWFSFFFQDIRRILSFTFLFPSARQSSATYAAHFYATARVVRGTEIWESGQLWMVACW